jgi:hypothetical protein
MFSRIMRELQQRHMFAAILVLFMIGDPTRWSTSAFSSTPSLSLSGRQSRNTALSAERRPWNVFRFVQQSSRFVNPFPTTGTGAKRTLDKGQVLWKAGSMENDFTFAPLDDVVMGGASASRFDQATGKWIGEVTDANNGGFIGIRSTPFVEYDMSSCKGIQLQITPSKKESLRLKVVVRDSTDFNGIGWTTSFDVAGNGCTVKIPFEKQAPTRFAQTVSGQIFAKDQVRGMQLVFSKFEYDGALNPKFQLGDFQVQVEEIRTY